MQRKSEKREAHAQQFSTQGHLPAVGYLRQSQLIPAILPFSGSTLWRKINAGEFPKPVKLSTRVTAWRVEDIRNWMTAVNDLSSGAQQEAQAA